MKTKQGSILAKSTSQTTSFRTAHSAQSNAKRVSAKQTKVTKAKQKVKAANRSGSKTASKVPPKAITTSKGLLPNSKKAAARPPRPPSVETEEHSKPEGSIRKAIFSLLHQPTGFEYLYHVVIVLLVIIGCCTLNVLKPEREWNDDIIYEHYQQIHLAMCTMDSMLTVLLFGELLLRFWAAAHLTRYCGVVGKCLYISDYLLPRLLDLAALITFFGYLIFNYKTHIEYTRVETLLKIGWWRNVDIAFRFAHVLQVFQVYRVIFKLAKPVYRALIQQANQLILALFIVAMILLLCSQMVFITNVSTSKANTTEVTFAESVWTTFVTFSTLGYDSYLPFSKESLLMLCVCGLIGVWAFTLPSVILGNGLSITMADQRRMTFKYVSIAEMIRTAITHKKTRRHLKKSAVKRRSHLLTHHLKSFTKLNLLDNDRLFKINYDELDYDDHDHEDEVELWDKLLKMDSPNASSSLNLSSKKMKDGQTASDGITTLPSVVTSEMNLNTSNDRVIDNFHNMDLSKYSNENSLLWYNLGLIEEGMEEMTEVVCHKLVKKVGKIRNLAEELVATLEEANMALDENRPIRAMPSEEDSTRNNSLKDTIS